MSAKQLGILVVVLSGGLFVTACGESDDGVMLKHNAAKSVGDLLTYSLNTTSLDYEYSILEPTTSSGSGTLTPKAGFGNYVYTASDGALVVLFPNSFVLVAPAGGGIIAGVPALTTSYSAADIVGVYNYVFISPLGATDHGTFEIEADGTWRSWAQVNGNVATPPTATNTGTWVDQGAGIISAWTTGVTDKAGNVMLLPSKVLIIDHTDAVGGGMTLGMRQTPLTSGQFDGTYDVLSTGATDLQTVSASGTSVTGAWGTETIALNVPWAGFATGNSSTVGLCLPANDLIFGGGAGFIYSAIKQQ